MTETRRSDRRRSVTQEVTAARFRAQGPRRPSPPSARAQCCRAGRAPAAIELPPLPYADNALDPYISANTIGYHYGKHHKAYVDNVNKLIAGTEYADMPLEKIVAATAGNAEKQAIFNNAAQVWNHTFYWKSMKPKGGGAPPKALAAKIDAAFGELRRVQEGLHRRRGHAVRQRLGVARASRTASSRS